MTDFTLLTPDVLGIVAGYTDIDATPYLLTLRLSPSWSRILQSRSVSDERLAYYRVATGDTSGLEEEKKKSTCSRLLAHASAHGQFGAILKLLSEPPQLVDLAAALNSNDDDDEIHKYLVPKYLTYPLDRTK